MPQRNTVRVDTGSVATSSSARCTAAWMFSSLVMPISLRTQHAELVALRVGKHDPGRGGALSDVDMAGAHVDQPLHLRVLVVRCEVQVQPVLAVLGIRYRDEGELRPGVVAVRA